LLIQPNWEENNLKHTRTQSMHSKFLKGSHSSTNCANSSVSQPCRTTSSLCSRLPTTNASRKPSITDSKRLNAWTSSMSQRKLVSKPTSPRWTWLSARSQTWSTATWSTTRLSSRRASSPSSKPKRPRKPRKPKRQSSLGTRKKQRTTPKWKTK